MKRTTRLIVYALTFERNIVANNIYDIGSGKYSIYGITVNHSCKDTNKNVNLHCYCKKLAKFAFFKKILYLCLMIFA